MRKDLLNKYNVAGPRYTSYPPANRFYNIEKQEYIQWLEESKCSSHPTISIYLHVPFCPRLCSFCGCNTDVMPQKDVVERYFHALEEDIRNIATSLGRNRKVSQVNWGGGTPNSVPVHYIESTMTLLRNSFDFTRNCEVAMECNPAYLDFNKILNFKNAGINRISLGIQDFSERVLLAINRQPSKIDIGELCQFIKEQQILLNLDFVYGLPLQTKESFQKTISKAIELRPDRLVTFSYAHIPSIKPDQKKLEAHGLPSADDKMNMLLDSYDLLVKGGYVAIGMDHYAKPEDELALALANKNLHRNFQGYCTREQTGDVYAFGSTSISQWENAYVQNLKNTNDYIHAIENKLVPAWRGYHLKPVEKTIRGIINEIMCNQYVDLPNVLQLSPEGVQHYMENGNVNIASLQTMKNDGLLTFTNGILTVLPEGKLFLRNIAMAFDPAINTKDNVYSKTV